MSPDPERHAAWREINAQPATWRNRGAVPDATETVMPALQAHALTARRPERAVFLGAGALTHAAPPPLGWALVLRVVLARLLAVVWSDAPGLAVDDPFAGMGRLSRVMPGVTLYQVTR